MNHWGYTGAESAEEEISNFLHEKTTPWEECRIGVLPRQCFITKKWLWPFTKATSKCLIHVSINGIYSKQLFANTVDALIANLTMKYRKDK